MARAIISEDGTNVELNRDTGVCRTGRIIRELPITHRASSFIYYRYKSYSGNYIDEQSAGAKLGVSMRTCDYCCLMHRVIST